MNPREYARQSGSGVDGSPLASTGDRGAAAGPIRTDKHKGTRVRLERAAAQLAQAQQTLAYEVSAARYHGMSLRDIARAAGVSHEQVRRMIEQSPR